MKKLVPLIIVLLSVFLDACTKNHKKSETAVVKGDILESGTVVSTITCSGSCADGNKCRFRVDADSVYGACICVGCTLIIYTDYGRDSLVQEDPKKFLTMFLSKEIFLHQFESYLHVKHGTAQYSLNSVEYCRSGNDYYIIYDYYTSTDISGRVMYVHAAGIKTQVECDAITTARLPG